MIPVTTLQGLEPEELKRRIGARAVAIWGQGDVGLDVLTSLRGAGIVVSAVLHSGASRRPESSSDGFFGGIGNPVAESWIPACAGMTAGAMGRGAGAAFGLPLLAAGEVLALPRPARPFVVIASVQFRAQAEAACVDAGLCKGDDFVDHLAIRRPVGVIEVAGPGGMMPLARFQAVLEKMHREQPQLCHVELAWLDDPLRNPELPAIVAHCEGVVPCTVSTRLHVHADFAGLAAAAPSRFNILAEGVGTPDDARWVDFFSGLDALKAAMPAAQGRTRFTLKYLRGKGDPEDGAARWQARLAESGIALAVEAPYPFPYDVLLARAEGRALSSEDQAQLDRLPWNLALASALAVRDREHPCLSQRLFPVIGPDLAVGGCHLYADATLAAQYLDASWEDLIRLRYDSPQCRRCQAHGLHRLDLPVLRRRFPEVADGLS